MTSPSITHRTRLNISQILFQPLQRAFLTVAPVFVFAKAVSFTWVEHQLNGDASVPLRHGRMRSLINWNNRIILAVKNSASAFSHREAVGDGGTGAKNFGVLQWINPNKAHIPIGDV